MHISLSASPCINNNAKERRAREPFDLRRDRFAINDSFCRGREGERAEGPFCTSPSRISAQSISFTFMPQATFLVADNWRRGLSYRYDKISCIFLSGKCWFSFTGLTIGDMYKLRHRGRGPQKEYDDGYKLCSCD